MLEEQFIVSLYKIGAVQFGEYTLKSGKKTSVYINLRKIISYPTLLRQVASAMWDSVSSESFDLVCGVPYTALPIATCLSLDHDIPMVMRRKERKDYGTKQMIEGVFEVGQRCLIVEDVITEGASIIETAEELSAVGLKVTHVVVLIDREQGGKPRLLQHFDHVKTILSISTILNVLSNAGLLTEAERAYIKKFNSETAK